MTVSELTEQLQGGRLPQAAILTGASTEGRLAAARLVARAAVCSGERPLCGVCRDCRKAERNLHPDIAVYQREPGKAEFTVDKVRELRAAAFVTPNEAARSVAILPDADAMNENAQNALLKVLEEPPGYKIFLLLCGNAEKLLPTVRSRCALYALTPEEPEESGEARARAEALWSALQKGGDRAVLEAVYPWEKLDRTALAETLDASRRLAARASGEISPERFGRLTEALDRADRALAANVSAGHVTGLILAGLFV